jgi:hypothetical protein
MYVNFTYPEWICELCGETALKKEVNHGKIRLEVSTWHEDKCDICFQVKPVTQARDFGYPTFGTQ